MEFGLPHLGGGKKSCESRSHASLVKFEYDGKRKVLEVVCCCRPVDAAWKITAGATNAKGWK